MSLFFILCGWISYIFYFINLINQFKKRWASCYCSYFLDWTQNAPWGIKAGVDLFLGVILPESLEGLEEVAELAGHSSPTEPLLLWRSRKSVVAIKSSCFQWMPLHSGFFRVIWSQIPASLEAHLISGLNHAGCWRATGIWVILGSAAWSYYLWASPWHWPLCPAS